MSLTKFLVLFLLGATTPALAFWSTPKRYTIMISPAGDAQNPGRQLAEDFERGLSRQLAEELKKRLEDGLENARIILSHDAGETVTQEQKANFANRLNVDLYIALSVTGGDRLTISPLYYKASNFTAALSDKLALYPASQAYLTNAEKTALIAKKLIPTQFNTKFTCNPAIGAPLKSLEGIAAPAFDIEITLSAAPDLLVYLEPLAAMIEGVAHER